MIIKLVTGIIVMFILLVAVLIWLYTLSPTMIEIEGRGLVEYISINVINDSDKNFEENQVIYQESDGHYYEFIQGNFVRINDELIL